VLLATRLALLAISISTTTITALTVMAHELDMPPALMPWVMNIYILSAAALLLLGGRLTHDWGARPVFLTEVTLLLLSSVSVALARDTAMVLAGRAAQGLCLALVAPSNVMLCKRAFPPEEHLLAIGLLGGTGGLAFAVGLTLGGLLTHYLSWRYVFWLNIPLVGLTMALLAASRVRTPAPADRPRVDLPGQLLLATGMGGILLGLSRVNSNGWLAIPVLGLLVIGVIGLLAFAWYERRVRHPLLPLAIFRNRPFDRFITLYGFVFLTVGCLLYFFSLFVQSRATLNYSAAQAGIALLPFGLLIFSMSFCAKVLHRRWGARQLIVSALLLSMAGYGLMIRLPMPVRYVDLLPGLCGCGIGLGILAALLPGLAIAAVREEEAAAAGSVVYAQVYFYSSLGIALGANLFMLAGRWELYRAIRATGLPAATPLYLDRLLIGHARDVQAVLAQADPTLKDITLHIIQAAASVSYGAVMWRLAIVLLGALLLALGLRPPLAPTAPAP